MIASILIVCMLLAIVYIGSHNLGGLQVLAVCAFFGVGIVIVAFPEISSIAAAKLGVGRGADLVLYLSVVGGLFVAANLYFRSRRADRQLILVVRELALLQQHVRDADAPRSA